MSDFCLITCIYQGKVGSSSKWNYDEKMVMKFRVNRRQAYNIFLLSLPWTLRIAELNETPIAQE